MSILAGTRDVLWRATRYVLRQFAGWYFIGKTVEVLDSRGMPVFKGEIQSISYRQSGSSHFLVANIYRPTPGRGYLHIDRTFVDVHSLAFDPLRKHWTAPLP